MDETTPETTAREVGSRRRSHKAPPTDPSTTQHGASEPMRAAILPSTVTSDETDVSHVLRMLRRRKAVVLGTTTFMVVLAVLVTLLRSAQYEATAEVLLRRPIAVTGGVADATDPERAIQDEIRFIESDVTRELVTKRLGREVNIKVSAGAGDDLLSFTASDGDADAAAAAANAYAQAYLDLRTDELTADAAALRRQIVGIDQRLAELPPPAADAPSLPVDPVVAAERSRLADQRAEVQSTLLAAEARLAGAGDRPRLVTPAEPPTKAPFRGLVRNVLVTLVIGVVLGCVLAAIVELLDRRLHDEGDVERVSGLATLATVDLGRSGGASPTTASESCRALHFWLFPPSGEGWPRVVAVVPVAGDGAAAEIVVGLGRTCASAARRVLLVALDLRGSRLHRVLGVSNDVGLASVLGAGVPLDEAVQSAPGHEGLSVIVAGPPSGADLFAACPVNDLLERLRGSFDVVILEAPPAVGGADSLTIASVADATVLAVCEGTKTDAVREAVTKLERGGAAVRGTVFVRGGTKRRLRPVPAPSAEAASEGSSSLSTTTATAEPTPLADETAQAPEAGQGEPSFKRALR